MDDARPAVDDVIIILIITIVVPLLLLYYTVLFPDVDKSLHLNDAPGFALNPEKTPVCSAEPFPRERRVHRPFSADLSST